MNTFPFPDAAKQSVALALVLSLLVAWVFSGVALQVLRGRARLGRSTAMIISILGTALGLLIVGGLAPSLPLWSAWPLLTALAMSVLGIAVYGALVAHFQRPQYATTAELIAAGESERVEFKSTARVNLRTGAKDERMEQIVAKTLCAFLNADGGTLLIGVDDAGTPLGLDPDFGTLKTADVDRFELWLRDLVSNTLGQNAAALIHIEFTRLPGADGVPRDICRATAPPGTTPTYFRPNKSSNPEFWARLGNSSRQLTVDSATEYVMHRWPLSPAANAAAQVRAVFRSPVADS